VAKYCRELGMQNKIGFFLHIPFAPLFIWQKIPCAQQLIEDLCQYDVVGLQTDKDQKVYASMHIFIERTENSTNFVKLPSTFNHN
jgi:trehalose-6-phosphate synthase